MSTVRVNRVTLGVESFGRDDAPLVLLAGGTTMLSWPDALCEHLTAGGRRAVRYDLCDSGESTTTDPEAPACTLRDLAADAAALAGALGGGPTHLAGIGVGGTVAQVAALDRPGAFSALTLVGTRAVAPGPPDDDLPDHDRTVMRRLFARPMPDGTDREAVAGFAADGAEILGDDPVAARAIAAHIWDRTPGTAPPIQMTHQMGTVFSRLDRAPRWRERLPGLEVPTLVVHGRRDRFFPVGNGEAIAREIPGARLLVLEGAATAIPRAAVREVTETMLAVGQGTALFSQRVPYCAERSFRTVRSAGRGLVMAGLRLGPLLRHVDWESGTSATVWVETDRACTAEVRCPDGAGGAAPTFRVAGHHYALVVVTGLAPGTATPYEVLLDGERVWPLADSSQPPSTIRTPPVPATGAVVAFGSCRWAAPAVGESDPVGPDVLDTLSARLAADPEAERPDVLLLLGDQVYADETSADTRAWIARHRQAAGTGSDAPPDQVADYEEYTHLYDESWGDPELRWLFSTVPSCMIFDDHDVVDDWNTSAAWVADMRATPWWHERITGGLMSYWVYQHLGNLSPAELAEDELYAAVLAADDATEVLRAFAERADADPASARWSYRRDFGRTRLLMVDTRAARVLEEQHRTMLDAQEAAWLRTQVIGELGDVDHLLIGTSLPWLLPPMVHFAESWNAALCRGERGPRWARFGEWLRRRADLEHWAAFTSSFERLTETIAEVGGSDAAPATVCVLSGDVHHAYVAEPVWTAGQPPRSRVFQFTCSPLHNSAPAAMRVGFRFGWSRVAKGIGHLLARHGRIERPAIRWERSDGPWFGNQLMTLTLRGRTARLRLEKASADAKRGRRETDRAGARLVGVLDRNLTKGG